MPRQRTRFLQTERKTKQQQKQRENVTPCYLRPCLLLGLCTEFACLCLCLRGTTSAKVFSSSAKLRRQLHVGSLFSGGGSASSSSSSSSTRHVFLCFSPHFPFSQNLSNALTLLIAAACRCRLWGLLGCSLASSSLLSSSVAEKRG